WSTCAMMEKFLIFRGSVGMTRRGPRGEGSLQRARLIAPRARAYQRAMLGSLLGRLQLVRTLFVRALLGFRQAHLSGQGVLVALEHEVDALADVDGDGNLRSVVQQVQALVLLRRDVNGGGDLLA